MNHSFSQPTSPVARGHVLAILDPGDPRKSTQTTICTPKTSLFSLAAFLERQSLINSITLTFLNLVENLTEVGDAVVTGLKSQDISLDLLLNGEKIVDFLLISKHHFGQLLDVSIQLV